MKFQNLKTKLNQAFWFILGWFDKNELLWDLGMQVGKMEGKSDLRERIMFYENEFDLVLLAERFDESLVVMKDVLCWDTQDIKYLKVRFFSWFFQYFLKSSEWISHWSILFSPTEKKGASKTWIKVFFPKIFFNDKS